MNGALKVTRVLLAAALTVGLAACSAEQRGTEAAPSASAAASQAPQPTAQESSAATPDASQSAVPESPAPETTRSEAAPSSLRDSGADRDVTGLVTLKGADSIKVEGDDAAAYEATLTPFTVVLDAQGSICDTGAIPHKCSVDQLKKALKSGVSLYAKVSIQDDLATEIEEIVRN
ncbi:hypothetical protein [Planobispora longispora]|uniref:Lipoprotein n=1 Tax=Planobispora longispora TaxID=28887 RepID=A0A8J3W5K7_9ACTN|nr:hypothetical protein [Planobispora longispora]GIH75946.1 hypothetical protein Plo01_23750 [Planobispora longispora]